MAGTSSFTEFMESLCGGWAWIMLFFLTENLA